jgi:rhodanese-related sulfurtransferase
MTRNPWIQGVFIIIAALVVAVVANGFASRERKLVLPGYYPDARTVPPAPVERVAPPPVTQTTIPTTTYVAAPVPGAEPKPAAETGAPPRKPAAETAAATQKPTPEPSLLEKFPPHGDKAYIEISGDDAAWLHAKGALFLDARRTSVYEQGHIAGARPYSVWESDVDDKIAKLFEERGDPSDQARPIVVYCTGGACEDSHMLSQKLWLVQFNNVYVYKDGFPDWQKRGGAVKSGAQP